MYKWFDFSLSPVIDDTYQLYFRNIGDTFSFDTYFNSIPINKVLKYTNISAIVFDIDAKGEYVADIISLTDKEERIIYRGKGNRIKIDISLIPENSIMLYLKLIDCKEVRNVSVYIECADAYDVCATLIICTYKREENIISNANYLSESFNDCSELKQIIIVDNGKTLGDEKFGKKIKLILNDNTGGSGGYSRGIEEAIKNKEITHLILMDDDVNFDKLSIQKMLGFIKALKSGYKNISVSGSMLYINKPSVQFEAGGNFSESGVQKSFGHYLDLNVRENLILNEKENDINYGGWWFMCMPSVYAKSGHLPMPFFMKYDDVEYALRCKLNFITLNGVSVWHEPFEWKYNSSSEYYNIRNYLFLRKLLDKSFTKKQAKKLVCKQMLEKLCRRQYQMVKAVKLGYIDYLKGIEYLKNLDAEKNHKKICELNYEMLSDEELFKRYKIKFSEEKYHKSDLTRYKWYMRPLLYGLLIPGVFCKKDYTVVDVFFDRKEMYFLYKNVLHYNVNKRTGYYLKK